MPDQTRRNHDRHLFMTRLKESAYGPIFVFWLVALIVLGGIAFVSTSDLMNEAPGRDIWQHFATLKALMDNPTDPVNPFVVAETGSRHFHPIWVSTAYVANFFGLSIWASLTLAAYVSMAILAIGIFLFSKSCYASRWAPLVLLITLLFAWSIRIEHTGFHSFYTLLYASFYPATFLVGLSLILWGVTLGALHTTYMSVFLVPLVALMFATHQLGAVIGFIGAFCFVLVSPVGSVQNRLIAMLAAGVGLGLSLLWPYHNPLSLMFQSGNSRWVGGPDFYGLAYLSAVFIPGLLGLFGLRDNAGKPLILALAVYGCCYLFGLTGFQIAGRFIMPIALVLHIGLAAVLIDLLESPGLSAGRRQGLIAGTGALVSLLLVTEVWSSQRPTPANETSTPSTYEAAQALTKDISDFEPVGAFDVAAWPIVATGQRVVSVPWPEPGILDLADRQDATRALFASDLTMQERRDLAQALGVRSLFVDQLQLHPDTLLQLEDDAVRRTSSGNLVRFDLFD